jgi:acetolactate decarboxylase
MITIMSDLAYLWQDWRPDKQGRGIKPSAPHTGIQWRRNVMLTRRRLFVTGCAACAVLASSRLSNAVVAAATEEVHGKGYVLRFIGSIRDAIMMGKRDALLDLRTLKGKPHLWGLGALEGLSGEATIADGRCALARVGEGHTVQVTESYDGRVPFFVWAEVPAWQTVPVPPDILTYAELETFVGEAAKRAGLTRAFPFAIRGQPKQIEFHVIDAKPETAPGMAALQIAQIQFEALRRQATLVGFWSSSHQGIFTMQGSNMHVHFQTEDNTISGHVQSLDLTQSEMMLSLPKT